MNKYILNLLGEILHIANANKPFTYSFYELKDIILKKIGTPDGEDLQYVLEHCYSCMGSGMYTKTIRCNKCNGTGKYREFWSRLKRYRVGNRLFHLPVQRYYKKPEGEITVIGYIRGEYNMPFAKSYKAYKFLQFLFQPKKYFYFEVMNRYYNINSWIAYWKNKVSTLFLKIKQNRCEHNFGSNDVEHQLLFCEKCNMPNPSYEDMIPF